ncbi:transporter substrate-binding domain-containing protein [Pseudomonas edaphica]|uniref:histidine kinase n=3 Tax=Pseudomonas TaxID=286 RepID=A0A7Y7V9Q9_9PSED|nr:transporter substrate-binding domain-containing protein [Pseudomonas edaphica]NVZ59987.1 transporter substrate-binding domain-containing protein [Pseudomonas edaphica]
MSTPIFRVLVRHKKYRESFSLVSATVLSVLFLTIFSIFYSATIKADDLDLSISEQYFLQQNPEWIVGYVDGGLGSVRAPASFNYGNELLTILAKQLKVSLVFKKFSSTSDLDDALCQKSIDVVTDVSMTSRRASCAAFSQPYFKTPALILGFDKVVSGASVESLLRLRVVTVKNDSAADWLKILHPNTPTRETLNLADALKLIKSGSADVIVEDGAVAYPDMAGLVSLQLAAQPIPDLETSLHFAAAQDESLRLALITKAMHNLAPSTLSQLKSRWLSRELSISEFFLSDEERSYLASLPVLKVAYDPDWRPVAFINAQGREDGLASEYWREVVAKLGLKTELVPAKSWKQMLFKMASGQGDIALPVAYAESSHGQVLYSRPMLSFSNVIVTTGFRVSRLAELNGKKLVVSDPLYLRDQLKALLPVSTVEVADSPSKAMQQVVDGTAFAYIGNLSIINSLMIERFSGVLQIVAPAEIPGDLYIGVTSRYTKLLPLINRALRAIPKEQREAMSAKWLYTAQQKGVPWVAIKQTLWVAVSVFFFVGILLFVFYRRLRKEINQRCDAERSVGDQLQLRDALIETYPYPVVVKDVDKRYLLINHAYELAFAINKQDLLGRTTLETQHYPGDWSITIDELATQVMRTRENFHSEFSIPNGQGEVCTWLYWMKPFYRADQGLAGVMVSLVDITLIREADERAKSLEARLNRITTNLFVGVFEATQERGQLPVFSYLAGLLGQKIEDVLADSTVLFDTVLPEDLPVLMSDMEAKAESEQPMRTFFRCRAVDREMHIRVDAVPEKTSSGSVIWKGVWVDVTESREKSLKLSQAKEAAEEATHAKSQFLATMSHEIRTPMNGILGLLELLHSKSMSPDQQQIMQMIDESAKSLMTVLNDVLDLSKIEFNQLQLQKQPTDLRALISSVTGIMAHQAHAKGLRVRVSISPALATSVEVDDMRLRQIILNLLSNAIKFTAVGTVSIKVVVTRSSDNTQHLDISINDTGPGMTSSQRERIFKPFTQGDESITRRYGGTGLGLVISQHLVRLMGGELILDSEEGVGTRVSVALPVSTSSDDSQFKMLLGKRVCIDLTDDEDRAELTCLLLALGLNPVHSTQIQPAQPCDLYFFDNPEKIQYFSNTLAVEVTATPILSGWRDSGSGYPSLSSNPFMWGSVVYVCRELLGVGTKNTSSRSRTETSHRPLILVAEDHPTNQALIKSQLDRLGFDCEIAANGSEALHQFNENVHCMVITDCYMPVMDGYSLAEKLRGKLQDRKNFPILAMTASILVEEKQRCASVGIDECLLKPLSLDTLRQALKRWLPDSKTFLTEPRNEKEKKSADWQALLSLLDESPEFKELIKGFIHTTEADIAYIESLSMPKEQKTLLEQLHRLRGGLQMFRLMELAGRSELIERELAGGGDAMSFELVNFLSDVRIILKYLKELVSERS